MLAGVEASTPAIHVPATRSLGQRTAHLGQPCSSSLRVLACLCVLTRGTRDPRLATEAIGMASGRPAAWPRYGRSGMDGQLLAIGGLGGGRRSPATSSHGASWCWPAGTTSSTDTTPRQPPVSSSRHTSRCACCGDSPNTRRSIATS
jgi:hypothetical protein